MPRIAGYIYKARQSYVLQRAVPSDLRQSGHKAIWKEPGGKTLNEARSRLPGFLERTDREIAIHRGELKLSPEEGIDRIPSSFDLKCPQTVELLLNGVDQDPDLTPRLRERMIGVINGEIKPEPLFTASDLIQQAAKLKSPAARTKDSWEKELEAFMDYCQCVSPLHCTREQAVSYRTELLERVSANTVKTRLAYLSGLWSILEELKGSDHIWQGLLKRIKVEKVEKSHEVISVDLWSASSYTDLFKILYYTGCRVAEVAGLRYQDIRSDRLVIAEYSERSLKSKSSNREIPLHPKLVPIVEELKQVGGTGSIWPNLNSDGRWGHNLAKPCKQITGVSPHGLRHRVATRLRESNFNEACIGKLLGHTPNTITGTYGSIPWERLVEAVNSL